MWKKTTAAAQHYNFGFESSLPRSAGQDSEPLPPRGVVAGKVNNLWPQEPLNESRAARQAKSPGKKHYTWDQWFALYKIEAGKANPFLAVNKAGGSLIDFMDKAPLQEAHARNLNPRTMGRFFGAQFEA